MGKGLEHHDATEPSVEEVESVKRHAEQRDERVISAGHQEERDHVDDGKITGPIPHQGRHARQGPGKVDGHDAKGHIGREVADQKDQLHSRGQRPDVDGRAELKLAVVALAENGRVLHVLLEPRVLVRDLGEIALLVVVDASHRPDVSNQQLRHPPGEKDDPDATQNQKQIVREHRVDNERVNA